MNNKVKTNPKISIITVCYNEENEIADTCKSVVSQNYNNYEWIVVDGGSTDKTLEILDKYKSNISVLISEKDNGVYSAMNKGIKMAKGEYLLFLNGGDYLYDNKVLKKIFHRDLYTGDVLYGNCCVLKKDNSSVVLDFPRKINKYFFLDNCINHQSTFIKKELFEKYGYYDENYKVLADFEKWICFAKNKVILKKIPFVVSNFKNFDGLSSSEKTRVLTQKDKSRIIKKYFTWYELLFNKLSKYRIKIPVKIRFILFTPKKFILKYWHKFLNNPWRQPARKIWYFIINKKIIK
ncbi:MAG: Glycosyl transferase family protein [Candidatus Moranbacteria bacterium GW2011_GWE1_35_17]|nr:MAG: Glycosyl transferase family protein [Candidatus Moranbacteria bacterium GW2011_GWE1_35_17]KKP72321.1 MAG: Glycosyl transferase family protein [Candidatus Moranbacteria bacterium GW2011_GWE2_35_164]KKP80507.1 MAG: Glycosyl transferase family protein [Candidatus Moranbacteria bacterium GW2011_GWF1_35_5]KKP84098.1 MAG: Glycosyl transferase family protein [Candidatus Moranbacteria bacterium GW2011_GWF2_35_54]